MGRPLHGLGEQKVISPGSVLASAHAPWRSGPGSPSPREDRDSPGEAVRDRRRHDSAVQPPHLPLPGLSADHPVQHPCPFRPRACPARAAPAAGGRAAAAADRGDAAGPADQVGVPAPQPDPSLHEGAPVAFRFATAPRRSRHERERGQLLAVNPHELVFMCDPPESSTTMERIRSSFPARGSPGCGTGRNTWRSPPMGHASASRWRRSSARRPSAGSPSGPGAVSLRGPRDCREGTPA